MTDPLQRPCTAFRGDRLFFAGPLIAVAMTIREELGEGGEAQSVLVFDDATGRVIDLDLRGGRDEIINRLRQPPKPHVSRRPGAAKPAGAEAEPEEARGRGRPKLGVVAREVTLLPRHWEWLADQPGGASVALRKLVEEARRGGSGAVRQRLANEAAYRFMNAMAGNLPGFEEATRMLFAGDKWRFEENMASWPKDIRAYAMRLAFAGGEAT